MSPKGELSFENTAPKERGVEYIKTLAEIEHILDQSEEEQEEYINKRIQTLSNAAASGKVSLFDHDIHRGFLGPKMEIYRNLMVDPFVMDDSDLYKDLFETIKKFKSSEGWQERTLREIIPNALQWTLSKYFGNIVANSNTESQNQEFYLDHSSIDSPTISIKELRGKSFAVCAEKSAATQNMLAFLGMESELIASSNCRIPAESEEVAHYYILAHGPKTDMIYDPTNPQLLLDVEGRYTSYGAAMYPITEEQSQHILAGGSIVLEHTDIQINEAGERIPQKQNRQYTGPKIR